MLFLDEPTTGLDSASAHSVVEYISNLAKQTKVVCIMTIHQVTNKLPKLFIIGDMMVWDNNGVNR